MTYLFSSNVEVSNDIGNALPVSGNMGILNDNGNRVTILNPFPVTLGSNSIVITGNANIVDTVKVYSDPDNPVHVHLTELGTLGNLTTFVPVGGNVSITGNVNVTQGTTPWITTPSTTTANSAPFEWQVARGQVTGATAVNIFGYNASIGSSPQTVWDVASDYTFPPSASVLTLVSTSASDNNSSARVLVSGLDASWNLLNETVTLNGTSPVTTGNVFLRINQMTMVSPGSGQNKNVGTITAKIGATVYAQINPGISKTQMGLYSVAAGKTLYITQVTAMSGDAAGASKYMNFQCDIKNNVTGINFVLLHTTWQNIYQVTRVVPIAQGEKQDLRWQLYTNSGDYSGSIIVEGALLTN